MRTTRVLLLSLAGFFLIEGLFFHEFYAYIVSPDSSAGNLETIFRDEQIRVKKDRNQVVTVGDSRMDFLPRYADKIKSEVGYSFGMLSCPGTTPRDWYYILRDADPQRNRYAAIVIPVEDYDDAETWEDHANRLLDLHFLVPWLRLSDIPEFSGSYHTRSLKLQAALGILFKGYTYRADFQDLIRKPRARWDYVRLSRRDAHNWYYDYIGTKDDVTGVKIDWVKRTLAVPPDFTPDKKALFQSRYLDPRAPDKGQWSAYLKYWFGKIYEMYRGSGTKLIFVRLPRGPFVRPDPPPYRANSSVEEMASWPGVILDREHDFDSLEDPHYFFDAMHMNALGSARFSRMLALRVRSFSDLRGPIRMLFNTVQFFIFLAIVLALFYASPQRFRKWILLAASYYFYMSWNAKFIVLLLALTAIDYTAALWIERTAGARRKLFLIIGLSGNLGFLGFFKYYNFLADNFAALLQKPPHAFALAIILPLGISFHTFQSMSYIVDVYRGEQKPIRNPVDYALFIAFFPQLVAGPIVRAREFFADFYAWKPPLAEERLRGVLLVLLGLAKKMAMADQFAQIADAYFTHPAAHPGLVSAWYGTGAFAFQIFFDFSGYTDMAIGMALLMGFHFPANFHRPYLAFSITDFWRRWHMSLSRWLRDYLYIPLGGNRHGKWNTYRNLMLTMLLGGLWHGASWNFVVWGGYHGALLAIERMAGRKLFEQPPRGWLYPLRAIFTFLLVCVGWVFFRAATFSDSRYVISQMFAVAHGPEQIRIPAWLLYLTGISLLAALAEEKRKWFDRLAAGPAWAYAAVVVMLLLAVELIGVTDKTIPFVYFQF